MKILEYFRKYPTLFWGLIISISTLVIFYDFLLGSSYLLYKDIGSDSYNSAYPFFKLIIDTFQKDGFPAWSFQQGLGQNIAAFNFGSPFSILIYLLGNWGLPYSIGFAEFLKYICTGLLFFQFLKLLKFDSLSSGLGAILFAFSGYMSIASSWFVGISYLPFLFAFWLFSLEKLLQKKWLYFPAAVALVSMEQPFFLFLFSEISLLYLYIRFAYLDLPFYGKIKIMSTIILLGILGLVISGFFLWQNILLVLDSPRGGGQSQFYNLVNTPFFESVSKIEFSTIISRFFGNNLTGTGTEYLGSQNYLEAPALYFGLVALLLIPQAFIFVKGKIRSKFFIILLIATLTIIFPFFRFAFWGFTGNYYRIFTVFIGLPLILGAVYVFNNMQNGFKLNNTILVLTLIFWLAILIYNFQGNFNFEIYMVVITLLVLFFLLIIYNIRGEAIYLYLIIAISTIHAIYNADLTIHKRDIVSVAEWKQKKGYFDESIEAIKYVQKLDHSFYRIEKDYSSGIAKYSSLNDQMVQNYFGTSVYTSFNHKNHVAFMIGLGLINPNDEQETRWLFALKKKPIILGNLGVKYALSNNNTYFDSFGYQLINIFGKYKLFKNPYALPIGVGFDDFILESDFNKFSLIQKEYCLYRGVIIEDNDINKVMGLNQFKDTLAVLNTHVLGQLSQNRRDDSLKIESFSNNQIKGKINIQKTKLLYFSIPYDDGWQFKVNGVSAQKLKVNFGMTGILLKKGDYELLAEYKVPNGKWGILATIIGITIYFGLILYYKKGAIISK